jgi:hypothetical protein
MIKYRKSDMIIKDAQKYLNFIMIIKNKYFTQITLDF